jgi:hypothetical protein
MANEAPGEASFLSCYFDAVLTGYSTDEVHVDRLRDFQ